MKRLGVLLAMLAASGAAGAELREPPLCGTTPSSGVIELARHRDFVSRAAARPGRALLAGPQFELVGDLVVATDDGSLVSEANLFDLRNSALRFEPTGRGYRSSRVFEGIEPSLGDVYAIGDDATRVFDLAFEFPFYESGYRRVFLNSDGNLTFDRGDSASSPRSLGRFFGGPPRIALFFADLDPSAGGEVRVANFPDRFVVTWSQVPEWADEDDPVEPPNSFQVELTPGGAIHSRYGVVSTGSGIVGVSPGAAARGLELADLSAGEREAEGALAERFQDGREVDTVGLSRAFYDVFDDDYDALVVWTDFDSDLDDAFAFANIVRNDVQGIGEDLFDGSSAWGSAGALESFLFLGDVSRYPRDPGAPVRGAASRPTTLGLLAHEVGHRWLARARISSPDVPSNALLGRQESHWSFFLDTDASFLEGNDIEQRSENSFRTTGTVSRYSRLDLYLMGLAPASEVGPFLLVANASASGFSGSIEAASAPLSGVNIQGERKDVLIDDVERALGPRRPGFEDSPKSFRHAWILLVRQGSSPSPEHLAQLDEARQRFAAFFNEQTLGRGVVTNEVRPR